MSPQIVPAAATDRRQCPSRPQLPCDALYRSQWRNRRSTCRPEVMIAGERRSPREWRSWQGVFMANRMSQGVSIDFPDPVIGATAIYAGFTVVTPDRHYQALPSLSVVKL